MIRKLKEYHNICSLIFGMSVLWVFIFICIPVIERNLVPAEMKEIIEEKNINPAHLFYSESPVAGDAIYDIQNSVKNAQKNN